MTLYKEKDTMLPMDWLERISDLTDGYHDKLSQPTRVKSNQLL
jgi:hypothetical protein